MKQTVHPGSRAGTVSIPASKSQAHRLLICAALGQTPAEIRCRGISKDIAATIGCLNALGAEIAVSGDCITVKPITAVPEGLCHLPCGESGSTLRFLLPLVGALGVNAVSHREARLPQRPLEPLIAELIRHGSKYGVKIHAQAPSINLIKARIETEIAPIVGNEQQAKDLIAYIKDGEATEDGVWDTNIFGKSVEQIVEDGMQAKISQMTEDCQMKLQDTLQKIINDSNGGMICIII